MRRFLPAFIFAFLAVALLAFAPPLEAQSGDSKAGRKDRKARANAEQEAPAYDEALFGSLAWREVGPYRGGRSAAVAGIPDDPNTYYFGATGGGVWKTTDGGARWEAVSDGFFGGSIGAVAVSEWDPNVVYVGTGEKTVRGNVSHGDGMWKSTDAGKTWRHIGLSDSRHIPRVRIHPKNPDLVYAAALGHLYGPNEERGVFRSKDGGATWEKILYVDDVTGAVDLEMDPVNPRVLYAAFWQVKRTPWSLESGGPGSSLWKSTDGGDEWVEISENEGLPKGTLGISGLSVSRSNPENVYAIIEAEEGGVFRSRDGGETWQRTNSDRSLRQRAWYYTRIYADPVDEDSVYVVNVRFHHSKDGGRTFGTIGTPHSDNHDLWIDPDDPLRMIEANDGGANVTYDGGATWSTQANQPTAQMYRVSTDNAFPYRLLGGQQDNSAVRIRSASAFGGAIGFRDWEPTAGGESGHIAAKPDDPDVVYGGSYGGFLVRLDHRTGETRAVNVWPDNPMGWGAADLRYRFQWNYPLFFSPHDPDELYAAANVLFRTRDAGMTWEKISPDLTRDDKSKQGPSGGPITKDNTSVEYYATIFAAAESPAVEGLLWAGSDDGLVHVSRDDGGTWTNVTGGLTAAGLPEWAQINSIEPHPFAEGGLYVAATRYKLDDFTPYLFVTTDYGATWRRIDRGIPRDHFTRVIRADPEREGLLYAGTERGMYVSFDEGGTWQSLQLELPIVPITDLAVKEGDLVAATQGRGYWILDDLTVLHQLEKRVEAPHLFEPEPAYRLIAGGGGWGRDDNSGTNPPAGVVFHYLLPEEAVAEESPDPGDDGSKSDMGQSLPAAAEAAPAAGIDIAEEADEVGAEPARKQDGPRVKLEILQADGTVIQTYKPASGEGGSGEGRRGRGEQPPLPAEAGANRFAWSFEHPPAEGFEGLVMWAGGLFGPAAVPGPYQARLTVGEWSDTVDFEILPDPRSTASPEDRRAQYEFVAGIRDKVTEIHQAIVRIREVREQLGNLKERAGKMEGGDALIEKADAIDETMTEVEEALYQTKNRSSQDPLNYPIRLNDKLSGVASLATFSDGRPTAASYQVRDELLAAVDAELARLTDIWEQQIPALNDMAHEARVPLVMLPSEEEEEEGMEEIREEARALAVAYGEARGRR